MEADRLYGDPDLAQFYDLENGWAEDLDHCRNLAEDCASVLDLGCGTGLFAASLRQCDVVGVDPAAAMLDIAAKRPDGDRVQWIQGDARTVRLDRRFDLVVLTGHAFQVFLSDEDRAAVLRTIAAHLAPEGRFIFDSRNPDFRQWRAWTPANSKRQIEHPA
ncbi:MAG TPA: class I SAM-dependent methyltransferase, partial [Reyranella sp.]|nr:class I SAM-dependent methyltransferase [Reyranella sp.]